MKNSIDIYELPACAKQPFELFINGDSPWFNFFVISTRRPRRVLMHGVDTGNLVRFDRVGQMVEHDLTLSVQLQKFK